MTHEERWQLAVDLSERMAGTYPQDLVVGGVYGSTALRTDTPWSDLELLFVVRTGCPAKGRHFLFRGTAVGYRVEDETSLQEILTTPSSRWAFHMGVLSVLRVLAGDAERVQDWLRLGRSIPAEKFRAVLEVALPGFVFESYGRILSCRERGNMWDITPAVQEVLYEMRDALCLLNARWVTHDYSQGLIETFAFPKLPRGYREVVPALLKAREIEEIVPLATQLLESFRSLLEEEGVRILDYRSVKDLPL